MYAQQVEENTLELLDIAQNFEMVLSEDYPDLMAITDLNLNPYPPAYDKWGEFDA